MEKRPHILVLYFYMTAMIISGAGNGIVTKLADKSESLGSEFRHPYFQSFTMFIGEACCMFVFLYEYYTAKKRYGSYELAPDVIEARKNGKSTKINPLLLAIPMICDAVGSTLLLFAYLYIPVSLAQMMQGSIVLVTALLSIVFLKRTLFRHHWTGLILVVLGISLVGLAVLIASDDDDDQNTIVGILLMAGSILTQGSQFVIEEKLLGDYYLSPLRIVGWEGIWGMLLFVILLPVFQFIPCDLEFCSNGQIEDTWFALRQLGNNYITLILLILSVIFIAGYNGFGITITKHMSATSRTTLKQTKIVLVWAFFLAYPGKGSESFKALQLVGFIILVLGIMLYNEIIVIPFWGFNSNTVDAIDKRNLEGESNYSRSTLCNKDGDPEDSVVNI